MSDAPERIWAKTNARWDQLENWYLKEPTKNMTEYIRHDIHADLIAAADALAERMDWIARRDNPANHPEIMLNSGYISDQQVRELAHDAIACARAALTAYRKARGEK